MDIECGRARDTASPSCFIQILISFRKVAAVGSVCPSNLEGKSIIRSGWVMVFPSKSGNASTTEAGNILSMTVSHTISICKLVASAIKSADSILPVGVLEDVDTIVAQI